MSEILDLIIDLIKAIAVVIVVAYLLTRTRLYRQVMDRQFSWQGRLFLIALFGAFSVWGTLAGVDVLGGIANTRDLGPALGGLLGGPLVGVGAGVIGAVQRLTMGGFTAVPCALATVLAGLAGGVVFLIFKKRVAPVWAAMLLAVFTESAHMAITLAMARPFAQALDLVCEVIIPMILVNAVGMGVFVFIIHNEERERVVVAQKERMEGELAVARNIQLGIVPAVFPPFPERREFDLHASLESAREVGGDLYDFQFVDDDRLYVAIGDVAGKGVPASLFMAITLTLLRTESRRTTAPDEVLARVNAALCRNNESAMFVTLFFGFYDVHSGELRYSSGGHPAPFVVRAGSSRVEPLRRTTGAGLGISEGVVFGAASETLAPGDVLVVYSDGVTEALDGTGEMFGEERLQAELGAAGAVAAAHATASLRAAIERFASGAEQYDDITLLALRRALDGG